MTVSDPRRWTDPAAYPLRPRQIYVVGDQDLERPLLMLLFLTPTVFTDDRWRRVERWTFRLITPTCSAGVLFRPEDELHHVSDGPCVNFYLVPACARDAALRRWHIRQEGAAKTNVQRVEIAGDGQLWSATPGPNRSFVVPPDDR